MAVRGFPYPRKPASYIFGSGSSGFEWDSR